MSVVVLYGRAGCHLCDEAREGLREMLRSGARFELRERDIEADPVLHCELLERIPVIEIDGERICELGLDRGAVLSRLATFRA